MSGYLGPYVDVLVPPIDVRVAYMKCGSGCSGERAWLPNTPQPDPFCAKCGGPMVAFARAEPRPQNLHDTLGESFYNRLSWTGVGRTFFMPNLGNTVRLFGRQAWLDDGSDYIQPINSEMMETEMAAFKSRYADDIMMLREKFEGAQTFWGLVQVYK